MMQGSLAARLRLLRVQRGLTLQEASDEIGIDRHTLSRIERGTQKPHAPTLKKIAEGYGTAIENLLVHDNLAEEPVTAPTSPKVEAPTSSPDDEVDEARRAEFFDEYGELFRDIYEMFRESAEAYRGAGDTQKIFTLLVAVSFTSRGMLRFIQDELGTLKTSAELMAMQNALGRFKVLSEYLEAALEDVEVPDTVVHLREYAERRAAG